MLKNNRPGHFFFFPLDGALNVLERELSDLEVILQHGPLAAIGLIKQNPSQIRGIFHLMGGNRCGISAWRLTCCIYVRREGSIYHGAVMRCLSSLSGGRGTRRKISFLHFHCLALGPVLLGSVTQESKDPQSTVLNLLVTGYVSLGGLRFLSDPELPHL